MKFKQFTLDPFQEEAIQAILNNESVVVSAPTGSGKTLIADFIIYKNKNSSKRIIYTAPIKALSNQKFHDFSKEYGEGNIGLMTGDIVINPHAQILIMTTEIYRNMAIIGDEELKDIAYVIFDEVHFINDIERGYVWEESIIYSSENVRFLCLSATIPNAQEFSDWIKAIKKHNVSTVVATRRNVPLKHMFYDYELGLTTLEKIKEAKEVPEYKNIFRRRKGARKIDVPEPKHTELVKELGADKLPCFFFTFSRKDCQVKARELARTGLFKRDPVLLTELNRALADAPPDISKLDSTKVLKETISFGIAFHHAGLLPIVKEAVENLFAKGMIKVLYTTETFAVGINMPAKTVCFSSLRKFDGRNFRELNTKEYFQIAGRAGRRGIDSMGYAVSMIYRPKFDYQQIKKLTSDDIEPIKSQFRLSVNTVLNLIYRHQPKEIEKILRLSFFSYQKFGRRFMEIPAKLLLARYYSIVRVLKKFGYIKNEELTEKGLFSSKVYADEISMGEIFATEVVHELDEYQILLVLAALIYEYRERNEFKQQFKNEQLKKLKNILHKNIYLEREKKFLNLDNMSTLVYPIYHGKTFFDLLELTSLLEGDLIRFFSQVQDRIGQIRKATSDHRILTKMDNCKGVIERALEGIYLV